MADNKINATEREENLGSFKVNEAFKFKEAIKKAKEHPVDCGIFSYIAAQKKKGKK